MMLQAWIAECCETGEGCYERLGRLYGGGQFASPNSFNRWLQRQPSQADAIGRTGRWTYPIMTDLRFALEAAGYLRSGKFGPFVGIRLRTS